jgi:hypothetical protein
VHRPGCIAVNSIGAAIDLGSPDADQVP